MAKATSEDLFWAKVDKNGAPSNWRPDLGPCWMWTAHIVPHTGYGQFSFGGRPSRKQMAHRYAYEATVGPIPEGLHLDHLCRVRACVNPAHLEAVTQQENNRRAAAARVRVTHCPQGHEYAGDNLVVTPLNQYVCRTCRNARTKEYKRLARGPKRVRTECQHGHPWVAENIYTKPNGDRQCRMCRAAQVLAHAARVKARRAEAHIGRPTGPPAC
jgi:hypothetical protein